MPLSGGLHPITQMCYDLNDAFRSMGFEIFEEDDITSELYGFDNQNPQEGRVTIPLLDADAKKTFYLCARKNDRQLFQHIKPHI